MVIWIHMNQITNFAVYLRSLKGHLHQRGKTRGAPARIPPVGSAVDRFVEIVWCCLHRRGPAAPPQQARGGHPQRLLTERFFCGTRRNRERWLVSIYRSMTQCREIGHPQMVKLRADPRQCKHWTRAENAPAPAGGPAPRWCKCAFMRFPVKRYWYLNISVPLLWLWLAKSPLCFLLCPTK